mgnify:CR=1 FL=1
MPPPRIVLTIPKTAPEVVRVPGVSGAFSWKKLLAPTSPTASPDALNTF